nr:uroporphyrinogen-III C-methyltransferase [Ideonella oryzae]
MALLSAGALGLAWSTHARLQSLESELVRRQQLSQDESAEARMLSRQAHDVATQSEAKLALLEAKVAETALQRSQVEDLISSLSRSRDENVLADVEAGLRVAQQQAAITGSVEPMMAVLKQTDERLARYNQPRLERVRRAVARDMDRLRGVAVADVPALSIRLDEVARQVDDLPLMSSPKRREGGTQAAARVTMPASAGSAAVGEESGSLPEMAWWAVLRDQWKVFAGQAWAEIRALVRVTAIDHPEAALVSPEQAFFLRENLKLHLLNARLALLSRQFDQAQGDIAQAEQLLGRYFDVSSQRVKAVQEQLKQVSGQSRQATLPRPDDTLAALTAAAAGH